MKNKLNTLLDQALYYISSLDHPGIELRKLTSAQAIQTLSKIKTVPEMENHSVVQIVDDMIKAIADDYNHDEDKFDKLNFNMKLVISTIREDFGHLL